MCSLSIAESWQAALLPHSPVEVHITVKVAASTFHLLFVVFSCEAEDLCPHMGCFLTAVGWDKAEDWRN